MMPHETIAVRVYRALLWMSLPRHVRGRFMAEAVDVFAEVERAARANSRVAPWQALAAELPGIVRMAFARRAATPRDLYLPVVEEQSVTSSFSQDLRYALRSLRTSPGFSAVVILTLALGIGANSAIFSVVNGVLLKPLAIREPDRVVALGEGSPTASPRNYGSTSAANFYAWKEASRTMRVAAMSPVPLIFTSNGEAERILGTGVLGDFFEVIDQRPMLGRTMLPADENPDGERIIVLSYGMWKERYGSDRAVIGTTITTSGVPRRVVGVMPADFRFPDGASEFWVPLRMSAEDRANHDQYFLQPIGRLRPGATLEQARAEMGVIASRLQKDWPEFNAKLSIVVYPVVETLVSGVRKRLLMLMGAAACVLLITCANLGNLLMARATARRRELAVRQALGAGRRRIAQQLLTESVLLSTIGAVLGLTLAKGFLRMILAAQASLNLPRVEDIRLDAPVLAFTLGIGVFTGVFFGTFPIWEMGRVRVTDTLRSGGRGMSSNRGMREVLVVSQLALAMVLLTGAGLLVKSFTRLQRVDVGFAPGQVLTFSVTAPAGSTEFFAVALERIRALPGVKSAALTTQLPMTGRGNGAWFNRMDRVLPPGETPEGEAVRIVTPEFFSTIGLRIQRGRALESTDGAGVRSVVINEAMARKYYSGENPLGKKVYLGTSDNRVVDDATIVGIVADTRDQGVSVPAIPAIYVPQALVRNVSAFSFVVRVNGDPQSIIRATRAAIRSVDATAPIRNMMPLEEVVATSYAPARWSTTLLGVFAGVALLIAIVGIFGVLSFIVAQRTKELGIRIALGASSAGVRNLVVGRALALALGGLTVGTIGSLMLTRAMTSLLFGVEPSDPPTLIGVGAGLLVMALLAAYIPARRATRIDPLVALRAE